MKIYCNLVVPITVQMICFSQKSMRCRLDSNEFLFFYCSRSVIFRRKRTESGNSLLSEGLREAISSYLQMTEDSDQSWDTWEGEPAGIMKPDGQPRSYLVCSFDRQWSPSQVFPLWTVRATKNLQHYIVQLCITAGPRRVYVKQDWMYKSDVPRTNETLDCKCLLTINVLIYEEMYMLQSSKMSQ